MDNRLIFLGDYCVSGVGAPTLAQDLQSLLSAADLVCVNLEAPVISQEHQPLPKVGPSICQPAHALETCKRWGITHFALANNHIMDYGAEGLRETLKQLNEASFFGAGLSFEQAYRPCFVEMAGKRLALLAFAEAQFGVLQSESESDGDATGYAWVDHPQARQAVRSARAQSDFVIVQVHAGLEMVGLPLPEWRVRYREFIDLGADLVLGHHPHVIQGSECYDGKMIYYSLGNFYMDIMLNQKDAGSGGALVVTIEADGLKSEFIPLCATLSEVSLDQSGNGEADYRLLCEKMAKELIYLNEVQKICDELWEKIYSRYYESALIGLGTRPRLRSAYVLLRRLVGSALKVRLLDVESNQLMLVHNIRIETHRWVVERALRNSAKKYVTVLSSNFLVKKEK
jgi:hypothetical protein